ncbi:MAG: anion permease [Elusimicrobia bacterium]|nr:anion permease [Elusimicrobiota bacterium]
MFKLLPGFYLGWSLGANDAANVFGPQAHSGIITYRGAVVLTSIFVVLGALIEGDKCFAQIGSMTATGGWMEIFIATFSAALMIHIMSYIKIPASTSHAIVGSLIGVGLAFGRSVDYHRVTSSILCWLITPVGAAFFAFAFYHLLDFFWVRQIKSLTALNWTIKSASIIIGCYGAYSLGANNLANVVGAYVGGGMLSPRSAQIMGGLAIAVGVVTYSKNVMATVGKGITELDPFSALVVVLSGSVVLHIFAEVGVPVSSSQAVVGAVLGVGLVKGARTVSYRKLFQILVGWIATLVGCVIFSFILCRIYGLFV